MPVSETKRLSTVGKESVFGADAGSPRPVQASPVAERRLRRCGIPGCKLPAPGGVSPRQCRSNVCWRNQSAADDGRVEKGCFGNGRTGARTESALGMDCRHNEKTPGWKMTCIRTIFCCALAGLILSPTVSFGHDETPVVTVSSASFERDVPLAPDAIASGFGEELATVTESAATVPLPTELAGTTVVLTDSTGVERPAQLVFVSVKQVNYLIPAGMATGLAAVRITSGDGDISTGVVDIASVSPGLFTANATAVELPRGRCCEWQRTVYRPIR